MGRQFAVTVQAIVELREAERAAVAALRLGGDVDEPTLAAAHRLRAAQRAKARLATHKKEQTSMISFAKIRETLCVSVQCMCSASVSDY